MKITASRRDDIIRERDAFDTERDRRKTIRDKQSREYRKAQDSVFAVVEDAVRSALAGINLDLNYRVDTHFMSGIEVQVDNGHDMRDDNRALSWSWSVYVSDKTGEIKKESNSWSGLSACTSAQLTDLQESVKALTRLNELDWPAILDVELPNYEDYYTSEGDSNGARPDYESQLVEADLEDSIGHALVKGAAPGRVNPVDSRIHWYGIIKMTAQQVVYFRVPGYYLEDHSIQECVEANKQYEMRTTKQKFYTLITRPVELMEY